MAYITRDKLINLVNIHHGKSQTLKQRFLRNIGKVRKTGCIHWLGARSACGDYGILRITIDDKSTCYKAHRLAYQLFKDEIPPNMLVLHSCGNSRCINHNHLYLGTQKENSQDTARHCRDNKGERHGMSVLTAEKVKLIKALKWDDLSISKMFKVSRKAIYDIKHNRTWSHIL